MTSFLYLFLAYRFLIWVRFHFFPFSDLPYPSVVSLFSIYSPCSFNITFFGFTLCGINLLGSFLFSSFLFPEFVPLSFSLSPSLFSFYFSYASSASSHLPLDINFHSKKNVYLSLTQTLIYFPFSSELTSPSLPFFLTLKHSPLPTPLPLPLISLFRKPSYLIFLSLPFSSPTISLCHAAFWSIFVYLLFRPLTDSQGRSLTLEDDSDEAPGQLPDFFAKTSKGIARTKADGRRASSETTNSGAPRVRQRRPIVNTLWVGLRMISG